jgi:hypothetical protein
MQKVKTHRDWLKLSDQERETEYFSWNVYESEGLNIVKEAVKRFMKKYKERKNILKVGAGIYHGGIWTIDVTFEKNKRHYLPKSFEGFWVK